MKNTLLTLSMITVIAASFVSCGWQMKRNTNAESSSLSAMNTMNDTTKIMISVYDVDSIKLLFGDDGHEETLMQESDYADFADYLSTAAYDTNWNDSGIMVKMVTPDYTAIVSYKDSPAHTQEQIRR